MTTHIFVLRFADGVSAEQKTEAVKRIRALQGTIPGLLEVAVGLNGSPRGQGHELGGAMTFSDAAAMAAYNDHPVHKQLLNWLGPLVANAIEVDFGNP